ncbi:MAG: TFIIB-type zinc ribbon-containing protein [Lachnospiraceae bacterium]|nr:TFIIB-type zinc ribbon-containing protein [Lachnospiraceae bacterium]
MAVMSYKCPNCGGGLTFDPKKQQLVCEYCLSEFTEEEMKRLEAEEAKKRAEENGEDGASGVGSEAENGESAWNDDGAASESGVEGSDVSGADDDKDEGPVAYMCPSCGAEIVTDVTTAATFCYYCHNPVVLSGRVSGEFLPDYVLPFAIDRKQAEQRFMTWIGKKKFVPKSFYDKKQIEKLSGVYFPYLLYSCQVDGRILAEGEKEYSWVTGNTRNTEHKRYKVERSGRLDVKNLTRNALSKSNKQLVEGVLPFETEELVPFQTGYLSGFLAEKRDMESETFTPEAEQEVKNYTVENLTSSISGYNSVRIQNSDTTIRNAKWQYALLPVWVMTYHHKEHGKTYYFAMNGQTGKICGKLPVDKGRLAGLFAGIFVPMFAFLMLGGWFL